MIVRHHLGCTFAAALFVLPAISAAQSSEMVLSGPAAFGDWTEDRPGVTRKFGPDDLPPPNPAGSTMGFPRLGERPASAGLQTMPGFTVAEYSDDFEVPRTLTIAPNGDVFVVESRAGRVKVMRPSVDGSAPNAIETFAEGLQSPFGVAFYPADDPQWVYVAENNAVKRFAYRAGDMKAGAAPEVIVKALSPDTGGHTTRDIAFTPDGTRMLISIGSQSNFAEGQVPPKSPEESAAFEREHGLGAAWGTETGRASVISFAPDGTDRRPFANGLRNCVGLELNRATGDFYCAVNERDALGDNLVPDYLTRVREGAFYGWPWYYIGDHEEPRLTGERPDLSDKVTTPDVLFQAHSAAINSAFYPAEITSAGAFPTEYRGDAFVTLHGSWNRSGRTGYKIVRVPLESGVPTGEYQDFVTGFVIDNETVWGRPSGIAVLNDGSLLFSDDAGNRIWRVTYTGQ
jgi:glucose/arabinose dehydrogenase